MSELDAQSHEDQAWSLFRVAFAASTALRLLIAELDDAAPRYLSNLRERLADAVAHGELWKEDFPFDEPWDGDVPLQAARGANSVLFLPWDAARELEQQLFTSGASDQDHLWLMRAAAVLTLHSTLEAYARAHGFARGSLHEFMYERVPILPAEVDRQLRELDATRHLFAHRGGTVDDAFRGQSTRTQLLVGERRPLSNEILGQFSRAVWAAAHLLREASVAG